MTLEEFKNLKKGDLVKFAKESIFISGGVAIVMEKPTNHHKVWRFKRYNYAILKGEIYSLTILTEDICFLEKAEL